MLFLVEVTFPGADKSSEDFFYETRNKVSAEATGDENPEVIIKTSIRPKEIICSKDNPKVRFIFEAARGILSLGAVLSMEEH